MASAPHVAAAIARSLQAKTAASAAARPLSGHVQAAIAAAQAKAAAPSVGGCPHTAPPRAALPAMPREPMPARPARAELEQPVIQGCFRGACPAGSRAAPQAPRASTPGSHGTGLRLPEVVQRRAEAILGTNLSTVRVHTGPQAAALGARAFTRGADIYFAAGQYEPFTRQGLWLLGHELAHVVQQRVGRARGPASDASGVVRDPRLEAEAERMGDRLAAQLAVVQRAPAVVQPSRKGSRSSSASSSASSAGGGGGAGGSRHHAGSGAKQDGKNAAGATVPLATSMTEVPGLNEKTSPEAFEALSRLQDEIDRKSDPVGRRMRALRRAMVREGGQDLRLFIEYRPDPSVLYRRMSGAELKAGGDCKNGSFDFTAAFEYTDTDDYRLWFSTSLEKCRVFKNRNASGGGKNRNASGGGDVIVMFVFSSPPAASHSLRAHQEKGTQSDSKAVAIHREGFLQTGNMKSDEDVKLVLLRNQAFNLGFTQDQLLTLKRLLARAEVVERTAASAAAQD